MAKYAVSCNNIKASGTVIRVKYEPWTCAKDLRSIQMEILNVERGPYPLECTTWSLPIKGETLLIQTIMFPHTGWTFRTLMLSDLDRSWFGCLLIGPTCLLASCLLTHGRMSLCDIIALELLATLSSSGWKYKELRGGHRAVGLWIGLISGGEGSHPYISCTRNPKANKPLNAIICNH